MAQRRLNSYQRGSSDSLVAVSRWAEARARFFEQEANKIEVQSSCPTSLVIVSSTRALRAAAAAYREVASYANVTSSVEHLDPLVVTNSVFPLE